MFATMVALALASSPPVLADGACGFWRGRMWGNDTDVKTQLWLCRRKNELCGTLSWSGKSGENVRSLAGDVRRREFRLRDVSFLVSRPRGDWRFCLIDSYRLETNGQNGTLQGSYRSTACADEAGISLEPIAAPTSLASCFARPPST